MKQTTTDKADSVKSPHNTTDTLTRTGESLHVFAARIADANRWPWTYSLGYASGLDDKQNNRKAQHSTSENDDYALGYHKGFASLATDGLNELDRLEVIP